MGRNGTEWDTFEDGLVSASFRNCGMYWWGKGLGGFVAVAGFGAWDGVPFVGKLRFVKPALVGLSS